jgi:hypothetical protein
VPLVPERVWASVLAELEPPPEQEQPPLRALELREPQLEQEREEQLVSLRPEQERELGQEQEARPAF